MNQPLMIGLRTIKTKFLKCYKTFYWTKIFGINKIFEIFANRALASQLPREAWCTVCNALQLSR